MRHFYSYLAYLLPALLLTACENPFAQKEKTNWQVSLKKGDKKPYGSYLAYQSLQYYFPQAKVEALSDGFRYTSMDAEMHYNEKGSSLLVLLGLDFYVSSSELEELISFVKNGNEVMLFCSRLDNGLGDRLKCYKHQGGQEDIKLNTAFNGKDNIDILRLDPYRRYGYEGRSLQSYFTVEGHGTGYADSFGNTLQSGNEEDVYTEQEEKITGPDTLGYAGPMPDFIRYAIGDGHITLHAAPLVMSNYFLLQDGNRAYLDGIWHTLPRGIGHIYWNEYYKRRAEGSEFSVLWRYPATRWALIIAIFTLLAYVLFESKRRQKIIPVVEQPENSSMSFVETVGRLYYNKGNHGNIAEKMIQHFLDWVRSRYHMNTNHLNNDFIQHLSKKTGEPEQTVARLVEMIHEVRTSGTAPDEPYLYELYTTIQRFYKNNEH